eukprot:893680_1
MAAPAKNNFAFSQQTKRLKKGKTHTASIIWMHGLGDTANGWTGALQAIIGQLPYIQCVLPTAPLLNITFQGGQKCTAWHDIEDLQNLQNNKFEYKEDSKRLIDELIENEVKAGIDPSRIILGGFSQGGAMAIYSGLQYASKLGGIICLSGYLCDTNIVKLIKDKEIKTTPIIMYHGAMDMVVQTQFGRLSAMVLKTNGFTDITWEEFKIPMQMNFGHNVTQEELTKVAKFVADKLPKEYNPKQKQNVEQKEDANNKEDEIGPSVD